MFLFYINLPFYSIHSLSPVQQSYSFEYVIENDDELHTLFTYINENEYHLRIEFLYDNLLIYYKSKFGKLLSSYDFDPTQMHNDSKITDNLSEQEYVSRLNDKAMLSESDFHFLEMKMKTDWEHIKKVMSRSDDIKIVNGKKVVYKEDYSKMK